MMIRQVEFIQYSFDKSIPVSKATWPRSVDVPDQCPQCSYLITPIVLHSCYIGDKNGDGVYSASLLCQNCLRPFIAHYEKCSDKPLSVLPQSLPVRIFDEHIGTLSPRFIETFNQSLAAESLSLSEIAGMGYRKSIEFLVKDYLIMRNPDESEAIQKEALGSCINNRIDNSRLKTTAQRAVWLGNDFTHYTRKYENCDLSTMKSFIEATIHWILMELITDEASALDHR